MNSDQKASIALLSETGAKLLKALYSERAFEQLDELIDRLLEEVLKLKPSDFEASTEPLWKGWNEVHYHLTRAQKLFHLKAPRMVLEYEIRWLRLRIKNLEHLLNGEQPPISQEEIQLKSSDLYDL